MPLIGAYSFVLASPCSALCTLASALSTDAWAEGMLPAEDVVPVEPPLLDPLPFDPLPLVFGAVVVVCGAVVVFVGVVVVGVVLVGVVPVGVVVVAGVVVVRFVS